MGTKRLTFSSAPKYQEKVKELLGKYPYRLDTNFAKIDRIGHSDLERFKAKVLATRIEDKTVLEWTRSEWKDIPRRRNSTGQRKSQFVLTEVTFDAFEGFFVNFFVNLAGDAPATQLGGGYHGGTQSAERFPDQVAWVRGCADNQIHQPEGLLVHVNRSRSVL